MNKEKTYKIAIVGDALGGGGAEKVHANLSVFFVANGIEVHNIIFLDDVSYDFSGRLLNLGKMKNHSVYDKLKRIYILRKYLRNHNVDYIIDFRYRVNQINEFLIARLAYNSPTIYTVRSGIIEFSMPNSKIIRQLIYSRAAAIVTVSQQLTKMLQPQFVLPVVTIYNPLDLRKITQDAELFIPEEKKYIVAVGRLKGVKQFDVLIEAYHQSTLPGKDIKLLIIGEGPELYNLNQLVKQKKLDAMVIFKGRQSNPFPYFKNAVFSVLSSKNEGFPNVLIECLATGTPVVSFDCFTGPNEIIINRHNGMLVENQNTTKLSEAIDEMILNPQLYQFCKHNARSTVEKFSKEHIGREWLDLMQIQTN